ncbi:hypothetical protein CLCR_10519 [Cladophialophora carrionii]|uniref:Chromo domain-containing protein n=1 Tax=Cladophialophora carrionii TaxID=86049 RepID=A0A1C1CWB9_9EURO|nr:hypothetical protein CLCR_10519 [Cladophialophora carrionii]
MVQTRNGYCGKRVGSPRKLRSGYVGVRKSGNAPKTHRVHKTRRLPPAVLQTTVTAADPGVVEVLSRVPNDDLLATASSAACEQECTGQAASESGEQKQRDSDLHEHELSTTITTLHDPSTDAEVDGALREDQEQQNPDDATDVGEPSLTDENVGIPRDGLWEHHEAYDRRFCYDHEQTEYLLGTANRWMSADEVDDDKGVLETMLLKPGDESPTFNPHSRKCQADCRGSLLSQVHAVLNKRKRGDGVEYLVVWKACWTPEDHVDDPSWIPASLEANRDLRRHRWSTRNASSFEQRREKSEKMMWYKDVDFD